MESRLIYVTKRLNESGIDFKKIPMEHMLDTCKKYDGTISKENYTTAIQAVRSIYNSMKT